MLLKLERYCTQIGFPFKIDVSIGSGKLCKIENDRNKKKKNTETNRGKTRDMTKNTNIISDVPAEGKCKETQNCKMPMWRH